MWRGEESLHDEGNGLGEGKGKEGEGNATSGLRDIPVSALFVMRAAAAASFVVIIILDSGG